ncbi:MAG: Uncharacterized protein LiPW41_534 [Parcubacteria group bacterium LiPW_41]|nr:MAG: Uncharacterized protein LiPW41_534 [Parcubacteria group bacterium LiPW_41]
MHIIIIEGITTSGKTSVFTNLKRYADEHNIKSVFISEEETTTPYIDSVSLESNKNALNNLVRNALSKKSDLLVFDRLYFAHTFKTGGTTEDFREIEELLNGYDTTMFFLEIPESSIEKRITESMQYRYKGWVDYVMNRAGGDIKKVVSFYTDRQRESKNLFNKSILKKYILDTASQNYVAITREIIDKSNIRPDQFFV